MLLFLKKIFENKRVTIIITQYNGNETRQMIIEPAQIVAARFSHRPATALPVRINGRRSSVGAHDTNS
jgi:hypothetical protein